MKIAGLYFRLAPYFFRNHLFVHRTEGCLQPPTVDPEYRIEFPFDVANLTNGELADVATDWKALNARREQGDLVGVVLWRGRIVHRSLVQTRGTAQMEGDPRAFPLARDEMYVHYCYTALDHRGKGLYPAMLHRIITCSSKSANPCEIFIACRRENTSSVRSIQRAGFRYLKSSVVLGVLAGRIRLRWWYVNAAMARDCLVALRDTAWTEPTSQQ
jgi:RimJ/RimL family protein N-acetyltransferase